MHNRHSRSIRREIASLYHLLNAIRALNWPGMAMKHKRRGAKFARFARSSRLFRNSGNRRNRGTHPAIGRCAAIRRHRALSGVPVPDPAPFYPVPRAPRKWDP
jgi:hypothetical protein